MHVPFSREWCRAAANELERLRAVANRIYRCGQCGREMVNSTTESGCPYCLASTLKAALREIDQLERAEMYERCPDCDYPMECSRECGCRITERKGTTVQQVVWRTIGRDAAKGGRDE